VDGVVEGVAAADAFAAGDVVAALPAPAAGRGAEGAAAGGGARSTHSPAFVHTWSPPHGGLHAETHWPWTQTKPVRHVGTHALGSGGVAFGGGGCASRAPEASRIVEREERKASREVMGSWASTVAGRRPNLTCGTGVSTGGCRLSELTASSSHAVPAADAYANISALADALSQPLILRFASEMNANWDDWDYGLDPIGNSASAFIQAFEFAHHYITKNLHTGTVLFVFAPNNQSYDGSDFASDVRAFWPGSANVDIIGLDGYSVENSFSTDFDSQLQELEGLGTQPLMLAEFAASTNVQGGRRAWLDAAVQDLQTNHPRVAYMNWFDSDKSHPYQLADEDGSGQSLYAAFAADLLANGP
jgi:glycosyl hydrolase family 26